MTANSYYTVVISQGGHWDTIRECQMIVTIKNFLSVDLSLYKTIP